MDGGLKIKDLQKRYDKEIRAEIECRGIQARNSHEQLSMHKKKALLKVDEIKNLASQ